MMMRIRLKGFLRVIIATTLVITFGSCHLFDKELEQDKRLTEYRNQISVILDSIEQPKERIKEIDSVIKNINEDNKLITPRKKNGLIKICYTIISEEYCLLENYAEAISYANKYIGIDSVDANAYYIRGVAYQGAGNNKLALEDYGKAVKLNSNFASAHYNAAFIYESITEYEKALYEYTKAISLSTYNLSDMYINRGNVYEKVDSTKLALADYSTAIKNNKKEPIAYYNRGNVYINLTEYEKATQDYSSAISIDSTFTYAYNKRAYAMELLGNYDNALKDYTEGLRLAEKNSIEEQIDVSIAGIKRVKKGGKKK